MGLVGRLRLQPRLSRDLCTGRTEKGDVFYNYAWAKSSGTERPGISVFYKSSDGTIYHTYSTYARGLDMVNGAYHCLDLVPKGRDEAALRYPMEWVRWHDKYED